MGKLFDETIVSLNKLGIEIRDAEKHIYTLLESCMTYEQVCTLSDYVDQLYKNVQNKAAMRAPRFWWRKIYLKEAEMAVKRSKNKVRKAIIEKYNTKTKL